MQWLIIINLGPVQDFIASARRSRDLWFGSWLLSELSKAAALEIAAQNSLESLIFPAPLAMTELQPLSELSVANKIVAVIAQQPMDLGTAIRGAVLKRLKQIRTIAFTSVRGPFHSNIAEQQVDDLLEFYWAALPLPELSDYAQVRKHLEALMAARKATRDFAQVTWGDTVPKSSLDGQRESVVPETAFDSVSKGTMTARELRRQYGVGPAERLCGVGLLKRHGQLATASHFLSTSHVAALPYMHRFPSGARTEMMRYIQRLEQLDISEDGLAQAIDSPHPIFGRYDGHLLFEERLGEFFDDQATLDSARQALRDFLKRTVGEVRPSPYYALLAADGDRMGKVIDHQSTIERHRDLSKALSAFARSVSKITADHEGSLVYAGGDDVLAFVPLHTAISYARSLALAFKAALEDFKDQGGRSPTLSVGISVSHHIEPLSDALEAARKAEKAAKGSPNKNALAITVSKRSGVDRTVVGEWESFDQRLEGFVRLHRLDAIPDGAAYELQDVDRRLNGAACAEMRPVVRTEAVRILGRKHARHGQEAMAEKILDQLSELISLPESDVSALAQELVVARLFADAADLAELPLDKTEG